MPREGRIVLPFYPHHIVQRGHNRDIVFRTRGDYQRYVDNLEECKTALGVEIYAWCLMTNHIHLLAAPGEDAATLSGLMKRLAGRQTRYYHHVRGGSGSLWEGRFKSSVIDTDSYLLACARYIDLNPVRAGIVKLPEAYPWSSCGARLGRQHCPWLDEHACFRALGTTAAAQQVRYRELLREAVPTAEWDHIREGIRVGLTGERDFDGKVSKITGRCATRRRPGRPGKEK